MSSPLVEIWKKFSKDYYQTFDDLKPKQLPCPPIQAQEFLVKYAMFFETREFKTRHLLPPNLPTELMAYEVYTLAKQVNMHAQFMTSKIV
jgi:hypothetical protein